MNVVVRTANNMREVKRAYDFSASIFGTDYRESLERKDHTLRHDKVNNLWEVIVATEKDKIIGTLRIVVRRNCFLGQPLKTSGITNVCVDPLYRRKGLGRDIVNKSLEVIRQNKYPLSIVVARRAVDGFYSKYGYVGTGVFCDLVIPRSEFTKVIYKNKSDFKQRFDEKLAVKYLQMYRATYVDVPMSFYRTSDWWKDFTLKTMYKIKKNDFINVINSGVLNGYFILRDNKIVEAACYSYNRPDFCTAIVQYGRQHKFPEMILSLSEAHFCVKNFCRNFNHTFSARRVLDGGHMIRIIDPVKVEAIIMQFIDKKCIEFRPSLRIMAKKEVRGIFKKNNVQKHDEASTILMALSLKTSNPVFEKVKNNIVHTWGLLDEF